MSLFIGVSFDLPPGSLYLARMALKQVLASSLIPNIDWF